MQTGLANAEQQMFKHKIPCSRLRYRTLWDILDEDWIEPYCNFPDTVDFWPPLPPRTLSHRLFPPKYRNFRESFAGDDDNSQVEHNAENLDSTTNQSSNTVSIGTKNLSCYESLASENHSNDILKSSLFPFQTPMKNDNHPKKSFLVSVASVSNKNCHKVLSKSLCQNETTCDIWSNIPKSMEHSTKHRLGFHHLNNSIADENIDFIHSYYFGAKPYVPFFIWENNSNSLSSMQHSNAIFPEKHQLQSYLKPQLASSSFLSSVSNQMSTNQSLNSSSQSSASKSPVSPNSRPTLSSSHTSSPLPISSKHHLLLQLLKPTVYFSAPENLVSYQGWFLHFYINLL